MRAKIINQGSTAISAWGSDSGGVTISPGGSGEVFGKSISMSGQDEDGANPVATAHRPTADSASGNPGSD